MTMTNEEYVKLAQRTKSDQFYSPLPAHVAVTHGKLFPDANFAAHMPTDIAHAIVGISTEAGELLDVMKKAMWYGKPVDYVNLDEEMGDVLWYIAVYAEARGLSITDMMVQNIAKLRKRFPEKFTEQQAQERDLFGERQVLEAHSTPVGRKLTDVIPLIDPLEGTRPNKPMAEW